MGQLCTNLGLNKEFKPTLIDLLGVCPQLLLYVYGDSSDGGTTPDTTAQASIDGLRALGIPAANIKWQYVTDKNLVTASITSASTIENVTLSFAGGLLEVASLAAASTITNVVLVIEVLDATNLSSASTIEEITLSFAGGLLTVANLSSASTSEEITLISNP